MLDGFNADVALLDAGAAASLGDVGGGGGDAHAPGDVRPHEHDPRVLRGRTENHLGRLSPEQAHPAEATLALYRSLLLQALPPWQSAASPVGTVSAGAEYAPRPEPPL